MKFNWKANWEILLVLVIIVVGIVITTIAAIRNKGKCSPATRDLSGARHCRRRRRRRCQRTKPDLAKLKPASDSYCVTLLPAG